MSRRLFIRKLINSGSPSNSSLLSLLIIYPYATKLTRNRILSFSLRKSRRSQAKQRFKILGKEQSRFWNEISIIPRRKSPSIIARFKKLRKLIRMAVSQHWEHKKELIALQYRMKQRKIQPINLITPDLTQIWISYKNLISQRGKNSCPPQTWVSIAPWEHESLIIRLI